MLQLPLWQVAAPLESVGQAVQAEPHAVASSSATQPAPQR
jgi:hypothetical protein